MRLARVVAPTGAGKSYAIEEYLRRTKSSDVELIDVLVQERPWTRAVRSSVVILDHTSSNPQTLMSWLEHFEHASDSKAPGILLIGQSAEDSYWEEVSLRGCFVCDAVTDLDTFLASSSSHQDRYEWIRSDIEHCVETLKLPVGAFRARKQA